MAQTIEVWGVKVGGKLSLSNGIPAMFERIEQAEKCLRFYHPGEAGEVVPLKVTIEESEF